MDIKTYDKPEIAGHEALKAGLIAIMEEVDGEFRIPLHEKVVWRRRRDT